jgi:hypothetical protein
MLCCWEFAILTLGTQLSTHVLACALIALQVGGGAALV